MWRGVYPVLFKEKSPSFLIPKQDDKVLTFFTSKQFSRDYPHNVDKLAKIIKTSLSINQKVPLIGFWGAANKQDVTENDMRQIEQLKKIERVVKNYCSGIEVTFILSDMHAIMNQYNNHVVSHYLYKISIELANNGFKTQLLSELWKQWKLTPELVREYAMKLDLKKFSELVGTLQTQVHKHFQGDDKLLGSKIYFAMRTLEAPHIQSQFSNSILFSYTGRSAIPYLPDMPMLFFYSLGNKISEPAWFLE